MKKVSIVVLGDIGRSPRMQYHGMSLLDEGYIVTIIGYRGSQPIQQLRSHNNVKFQYMPQCPDLKNHLPMILAYAFKVIWQIITLFWALMASGFCDYILFQNPPAVPALGVCYAFCKLFRCKLIVDWHNYAYSILALSIGQDHKFVKLSKRIEFYFGRKAHYNLCVTKAMKEDLSSNHDINAITFYDRPPDFFKTISIIEKHKLFLKLGFEYDLFLKNCDYGETVFTRLDQDSHAVLRNDRPALLISSTSWTEDEDFSVLFSALEDYENSKKNSQDLPNLICAITGKGPLKEFYMRIIEKKNWTHVKVITPWLESEDYPLFLGSADLGVCLHKSSSGLDLPMKVVDMYGCGVPVCAIDFKSLPELVKHKQNGFIFNNEKELSEQLQQWFKGFPNVPSPLRKTFQTNLEQFQMHRWHDNWKFTVQPLF